MPVPTKILRDCGIDTSSLRLLFEQEGYGIHALSVDAEDALEEWSRLRGLANQTECWPVIVGHTGAEELQNIQEGNLPTTKEILKKADEVDIHAMLAQWHGYALENVHTQLAEAREADDQEWIAECEASLAGPGRLRGLPRGSGPRIRAPTARGSSPLNWLTWTGR